MFLGHGVKYVTIKKCAELTGYSVGAIRNKIYRGKWVLNEHYVKAPDGRILINLENFAKWESQLLIKESKNTARKSA